MYKDEPKASPDMYRSTDLDMSGRDEDGVRGQSRLSPDWPRTESEASLTLDLDLWLRSLTSLASASASASASGQSQTQLIGN